ncbi:MAG: hypothetical protein U9R53_08160 [Chloroflexota bacterium]|nr:hypothetical protein [Chloroflexota bacterium]
MKSKFAFGLTILALVLAALACRPPWQPEPESPEITPTFTQESPTETEAIPPTEDAETPSDTLTETPTITPAEETAPDLIVFTNPIIFDFSFFTALEGWGVTKDGNHLLFTVDGGETWLDATPTGLYPLPPGISSLNLKPFFLNETTAWFHYNNAGSGVLYHTQDSGVSWTMTSVPFDNAGFYFLDLSFGYAMVSLGAGAGSHYYAIYRTVDSGVTWTEVFTHEPGEMKSLPEGGSKNGITFRGVDSGWIGGSIPMDDNFYLYYTEDGGITWAQEMDILLPSTFTGSMLDVSQPFFVSATTGYLPVRAMNPIGMPLLIYRSEDYGQSWAFQGSVLDGKTVDFYAVDEGWIAASTGLYRTINGGVTWSAVAASGIPPGEFFMDVDFVDSQYGWVLTTPDESTWEPLKFFRTTDGGMNWTQLLP